MGAFELSMYRATSRTKTEITPKTVAIDEATQ
jgi:hypothetical protein